MTDIVDPACHSLMMAGIRVRELALSATPTTYGCDIFLGLSGEKLADFMAQYEITEMMRQFGMLPPREGHIGEAYRLSLKSL